MVARFLSPLEALKPCLALFRFLQDGGKQRTYKTPNPTVSGITLVWGFQRIVDSYVPKKKNTGIVILYRIIEDHKLTSSVCPKRVKLFLFTLFVGCCWDIEVVQRFERRVFVHEDIAVEPVRKSLSQLVLSVCTSRNGD